MIRTLQQEDLDEFIRLRADSLQNHPESFGRGPWINIDRDKTRFDLAAKNEENFIVAKVDEDGKTLLGMAGFIRETGEKKRHKGMIWGVYVVPEAKGRGIGLELMKALIERAKKIEGLRKVNLSVTSLAKPAYYLYQKVGFEEYGRERCAIIWEGKEMDEIFMTKWLAHEKDTRI